MVRKRGCLRWVLVGLVLGVPGIWWLGTSFVPTLRIAVGFAATMAAHQHFLTGDDLDTVVAERFPMPWLGGELEADAERGTLTARLLGFESTARLRGGLGATRAEALSVALPDALEDLVEPPPPDLPWPRGSSAQLAPLEPDRRAALERALDDAFHDPKTGASRGTHAVVVVRDGRLVAERYAEPHGPATPLLGWSLTKGVTATLVGRLVLAGRLDVEAAAPVPEWDAPGDPRSEIRLDDLLRMQSGLSFVQNYFDSSCDSLTMLFASGDCAAYAAGKELLHPPGERWSYSDGSTNIVARIVRARAGDTLGEQLLAPQRLLFAPLGMDTAQIAVDGSGTFVGSSLMYASARDWARLGWLYAAGGVWEGERLLPEGWVEYVSRPTPSSGERSYGAGFWCSAGTPAADRHPELEGAFFGKGHSQQLLLVHPARRVVAVRLGLHPRPPGFDLEKFALEVLLSLD